MTTEGFYKHHFCRCLKAAFLACTEQLENLGNLNERSRDEVYQTQLSNKVLNRSFNKEIIRTFLSNLFVFNFINSLKLNRGVVMSALQLRG